MAFHSARNRNITMIHIGLGGFVLLLILIICAGGPKAVVRFVAGIVSLAAIIVTLGALVFFAADWQQKDHERKVAEFERLSKEPFTFKNLDPHSRYQQLAKELGRE